MRILRERIELLRRFIKEDIWQININNLSKTKARLIRDIKLVVLAIKNFEKQKTGFQSIALCYFCLMAVVPFLAICFALTNGFGLSSKLVDILYNNLGADQQLISKVMLAADKIIKIAKSGVVGFISALSFAWLVLWMMMRVELVFNDVWHVKQSRKLLKRIGIDIIIIILSPFVILAFFWGSIAYSNILNNIFPQFILFSSSIKSIISWLIFGLIVIFIFSSMYKFIPSAKVGYSYALKAAVISGASFTALQYLYLETQLMVTGINAVYGTLAAVPLFMLWLRFGWLIILYGAQLSYSFQLLDNEEIEQL